MLNLPEAYAIPQTYSAASKRNDPSNPFAEIAGSRKDGRLTFAELIQKVIQAGYDHLIKNAKDNN